MQFISKLHLSLLICIFKLFSSVNIVKSISKRKIKSNYFLWHICFCYWNIFLLVDSTWNDSVYKIWLRENLPVNSFSKSSLLLSNFPIILILQTVLQSCKEKKKTQKTVGILIEKVYFIYHLNTFYYIPDCRDCFENCRIEFFIASNGHYNDYWGN